MRKNTHYKGIDEITQDNLCGSTPLFYVYNFLIAVLITIANEIIIIPI